MNELYPLSKFHGVENGSPRVRSLLYNSVTLHFHDCGKISIVVIHWYVFFAMNSDVCVCVEQKMLNKL